MEPKKATSKTAKPAAKPAAKKPGKTVKERTSAKSEIESKPRPVGVSKTKQAEPVTTSSGHHHHKPDSIHFDAKTPTPAAKASVTHQQIAELAYSFYIARGHAHGSHEEDWRRAEQELAAR